MTSSVPAGIGRGLLRTCAGAWAYRGFVRSSVANDFRVRLARSRLGALWVLLQPLAQVVIFATVLSGVLAAKLPGIDNRYAYAVYLLAGMLCWNLFSEIALRCVTVFIDQAHLLRKMQFPKITLPLIVVGTALVNNLVLLAIVALTVPLLGFLPTSAWLWLPLLVLLTVMLGTGFGLLLGVMNVFSRDIGQAVGVAFQFWFWVTPVVYPASITPGPFKRWLQLNPVTPLVEAYHDVIVYGRGPGTGLAYPMVAGLVLLAGALVIYRRASAELVDAL